MLIGLHDEPPVIVPMGSGYHLCPFAPLTLGGEPHGDYPASRGSKGARMLGRFRTEVNRGGRSYCNFAYSALASFRIGMSGSDRMVITPPVEVLKGREC